MAGGHEAIGANPSADLGVIVAGMAIVVAGLAVVFYAHYHIGAYYVRRIKLVCYTRLSSRLATRATLPPGKGIFVSPSLSGAARGKTYRAG